MSGQRVYLAADLGASSGRLVAGRFDGRRIELEEIHRFDNGGVRVGDRLHWDVLHQWTELQEGLRRAASLGHSIASVGVDTWGVDFALLGPGGELLGNPYHYRDRRTDGVMEQAFATVPREEIFRRTGIQFLPFNTLYQLIAMRESPLLGAAERLLMMPDLFHWLLSGTASNEYTNATTTQMLDPKNGRWADELLGAFELPASILAAPTPPGTRLGTLLPSVARSTGLPGDVEVVLPGTHDTASAVLAVPATGAVSEQPSWSYISSGTWSLMGVELPGPVIDDRVLARNFTNEGGVGGTIRLLKNIAGLWLVQECRRAWAAQGRDLDWNALMQAAAAAPPRQSLIDPDHADFLAPDDMPQAITDYCRRTGQSVPTSTGEFIRTALESLALRYRKVLEWLAELTGRRVERIHVVGGGTRNTLLCQMTADACGLPVIAGPVEATALGNVLMQAIALGDVADIGQARQIVAQSADPAHYEPRDTAAWDEAFARWEGIVASDT